MAAVGTALTAPEAGWKRYDESCGILKYTGTGTWNLNSSYAPAYNGTYSYTGDTLSKAMFSFNGTKLRIIGMMGANYSNAIKITIDGVPESFSEYASSSIAQALVYEKTGLSNTSHTVEIIGTAAGSFALDAIDTDSTGRLLHPDEVTDTKDLTIGKRIRCNYKAATSGAVGTFSGLGLETKDFIPVASSATPDGDFYYIMVDTDHLGRKKLSADRNVQHSIAWDVLNTAGIASGSGLPIGTAMYTPNLIPVMTSNTAPSGQAFSSQPDGVGNYPWQAFDSSTTTQWGGNPVTLPAQLGYKFVSAKTISAYTLMCGVDTYPNNWTFEGSNDGVTYNVLHTVKDELPFPNKPDKKMFTFKNSTPYLYYRINITSSVSPYPNIFNIEMMEISIPNPDGYNFTTRLLTGGVLSTDKDNEWDNYIVNSTLNGAITAGDNVVWNWSGISTWTSTSWGTTTANKTTRGSSTSSGINQIVTTTVGATYGFRPVLLIEILSVTTTSFLFQDGTDIKKWRLAGVPVIPTMTSSTNGSVVISQSGQQVSYEGWRAFDKAAGTGWASEVNPTIAAPQWLQIDLGTDGVVSKYAITNNDAAMASPYISLDQFKFLGSNDAINWITLDDRVAEPWNKANQRKEFVLSTSTSYRYYRVSVTKATQNAGATNTMAIITELELTFQSSSGWSIVGQVPATQAMFDTNGMTDLSPVDKVAVSTLVSATPSLLMYRQDLAAPVVNLTAIPKGKLIFPTGDIDFTSMTGADYFNITATEAGGGIVRMIVSVDSGTTWKTWDGSSWVAVDATNLATVKANGMAASILNARVRADWDALINGAKKIRFAYYLEISASTDTANTDKLTMQVDMRGSWKKAIHGTDYDYQYPDNTILKVSFLANGDYKVNY